MEKKIELSLSSNQYVDFDIMVVISISSFSELMKVYYYVCDTVKV